MDTKLSLKQTLLLYIAYILPGVLGLLILIPIAKLTTLSKETIFSDIALILFFAMVFSFIIITKLLKHFKSSISSVGYTSPTWRILHLLWQIPLLLIGMLLVQVIFIGLLGAGEASSVNSGLGQTLSNLDGWKMICLIVAASLLAPFLEELIFRGALYKAVRSKRGIFIGAIVSALVFAIMHFIPVLIPYYVVMGIGFALIFEFHKTLWASFVAHATINSFVSIVVLINI